MTTGRGNYACMGIPALGNGLLRAAEAANCILLAVSLILAHPPPVQEQTLVRVGAYQSEPKVFVDERGAVRGFFPEILQDIAASEGWRLQYVEGTWAECMQRLESAQIDLMVDVAYSQERAQLYDFNHETVLYNWSRVYTRKGSNIQSILDLNGKKVSVLKGSIQASTIKQILDEYGVTVTLVACDNNSDTLRLIEEGPVDAGIITRLYGLQHARDYDIEPTDILICPAELRFAVPKGKNAHLLAAIDRRLSALKADEESIYCDAQRRWFGIAEAGRPVIPEWIPRVLLGGASILGLLVLLNLLLNARVRAVTHELRTEAEQLSREVETRKQAEGKLRMLARIAEQTGEGVAVADLDGYITFANQAWAQMHGFQPEELVGLHLRVFHSEEQLKHEVEPFNDAVMGSGIHSGEVGHIRRNGTPLPTYMTTTLLKDEDGQPQGFIGVARDISARKDMELALRESEERYRVTFENTGTAVAIVEADCTIALVNTEFERLSGYAKSELEGKMQWPQFVAPEDRERMQHYHDARRAEGGEAPSRYEFRFLRRDGSVRDIYLSVNMIPGTQRSICSLVDISARKQAEERLHYRLAVEEALARASRELAKPEGANYDRVVRVLGEAVAADRAYIFRVHEDFVCTNTNEWCSPGTEPQKEQFQSLDLKQLPWALKLLQAGTPIAVADTTQPPEGAELEAQWELRQGVRAIAVVPVRSALGELEGLLGFDVCGQRREWLAEDIRALQIVAGVLSFHWARERAEQALLASRRELALRNRIADIFLTSPGDEMYEEVLQVLLEATGCKYGVFGYIDEEGDLVVPSFSRAIWEHCEVAEKTILFPHGTWSGLWGRSMAQKRTLVANEPLSVPEGHLPVNRALNVPVVYRDELVGNILVGERETDFTEGDCELLETLAQHIAPVLKSRLEAERHQKRLADYRASLERTVVARTADLERALRMSEQAHDRIDAILKSIGDGLIVTDLGGRVMLMNRAAEELLGVRLSDAIGRPLMSAIRDESLRDRFRHTLMKQQEGYEFDFSVPEGDSEHPRFVAARTSLVRDRAGVVQGVVTTMRDVTRERELDQMKTEFLSTAAHELRTPLTSVRGFSELLLLRDDLTPEQQRRYLSYVNAQAVALGNIISDLLDVSRIEAGYGFSITKRSCEVSELIDPVVAVFSEHHRGHVFAYSAPEQPIKVMADREKFNQVMQNLLSNAVKYSPHGGTIRVTAGVVEGEFRVSVADEGIGMTPDQISRIFEKFYRADASNTAIEGTGLGMTIVKHIVEAHGGRVWVESEYRKGTTVTFCIPLKNQGGRNAENPHRR